VSFADALWDQVRHGRALWVVAFWIVVRALAQVAPEARRRLRLPTFLLALYVLTTLAVAGVIAGGGNPRTPAVVGLAFELLALVGVVQVLVFAIALPRLGLRLPRIVVDVVTAIATAIALIVVGKRAGLSIAGLITTSAVLTAVVGFALQDTLGNLIGGLALQLDSSIKVGDWISLGVGQPQGQVVDIRWRYTAIETRAWDTLIVPNSMLMKGQVIVSGRRLGEPLQSRRQLDFQVDFRTPPTDVIAAVRTALAADRPPRVAAAPAPQVLFIGIKDSVAAYAVRYWLTDLSADEPTDSELRVRIYFALQRAGIELSIPAQAVFVSHDDDERKSRKQRDARGARLAALAAVDVFAPLDDDERGRLADRLRRAPFAAGETVTREGDHDDGLYIIVDGQAEVRIGVGDAARTVATLGPGQFFGEMALLTGEVRSATVCAVTDLDCYRLDKHGFEAMLQARPALADAVADILTDRKVALASARDAAGDAAARRMDVKHDLLDRIRAFFALR
jgi:small-conductance mechanosensitive channel/CRP-like cAMP-binding protein